MSVPRPMLSAIRAIRVVALGAAATILASVIFLTSSAVAYHDTVRVGGSIGGGGGSIGAILPIVIVVVIGMVGLGIWDRKKLKTKSKRKLKHKRR